MFSPSLRRQKGVLRAPPRPSADKKVFSAPLRVSPRTNQVFSAPLRAPPRTKRCSPRLSADKKVFSAPSADKPPFLSNEIYAILPLCGKTANNRHVCTVSIDEHAEQNQFPDVSI